MLFLSPGVRLYNKTCTHLLLAWSHSSCLCVRKVMWRVYVHKHVMTYKLDVSEHAQTKDDVFKHVVISNQKNILLLWHYPQWLAYVYIFIVQWKEKAVCSLSCDMSNQWETWREKKEEQCFWSVAYNEMCIKWAVVESI